ncbi:tRNA lysidine(34) synthetase TilS [Clostridium folliculivorans]|uniref:tRNA(Ile)-lysidine synthase n=1 Tax=Clostridium folliculivorans TaxID=2886038 RepID=A0A9W5Y400_9CLOT|nr:tRNA lysidine(34) synthetase TilS [Clostridium folliculivorans]GKU26152.1 tRNA(Ile)-lysidine synthase [Clostridium folliculivorans]GKU28238.1 tRNA(Ile)-lysidine synthase [Clostridium folliculivorans]
MKDKVINFIREHHMIKNGDKVLVALSGGPDSVCLLHVLYMIRQELGISLGAAHINHLLRGDDSFEDESYVEKMCASLGIPCFTKRVDIESMAKEKSISSEMAGREARYGFFNEIIKEEGFNKVAIAHNANDQAETILMRVMRGTGIDGLVGIKPVRDDIYIRPILCIAREEIEDYCVSNNLNPRIDRTNLESIYSRNKVRLEMIPFIKNNFNKDIVESLNRLASLANIDSEYIDKSSEDMYFKFCKEKVGTVIINKEAFNIHEALLTRLVRKSIFYVSGATYNFEMKHIYDIILLQKGKTGKNINLPNKIVAENSYGDIIISIRKFDKCKSIEFIISKKELDEKKIENLRLDGLMYDTVLQVKQNNNKIDLNSSDLIKYFDYDKIKQNIIIRNRKNGDKIKPLGMTGTKKIKDIFIDNKVPNNLRDEIPLVCFDSNISWIVGLKISDLFKVNKNTKKILQISFIERE